MSTWPKVWERQANEGEEEWIAFRTYRDQQPPRRLIRPGRMQTADQCRWFRDYHWKERVIAYDNHLSAIIQDEREQMLRQSVKDVEVEHMHLLTTARRIAALELSRTMDRLSGPSDLDGGVRMADVIKLAEMSLKFDRILRGQASEVQEVSVTTQGPDLSKLSADELRAYLKLTSKMVQPPTPEDGEPT